VIRDRAAWLDVTPRLASQVAAALRHGLRVGVHFVLALLTPWFPVYWLRGIARESGRPTTLLVAGKEPWVNYLPEGLFSGEPTRESIGSVSIWALPGLLRRLRSGADLTIARVDRLSGRLFLRGEYLRLPEWVGAVLQVPDDPVAYVRHNRKRNDDLRLVRRNRLVPVVSHDAADFDEFYDRMYVPYTKLRHAGLAHVGSRAAHRRYFRHGGIIWIEREGERVGGMLFVISHRTFHFAAMGAAEGARLPQGVLAAAYIYAIDHARRHGCTLIDYGGSRPSLQDGVLRYKRKWGITLQHRYRNRFDHLLYWEHAKGPVAELLSLVSPIFRGPDGLSALHVLDLPRPATAEDAAMARGSLWTDGLQRLYLFNAAGWSDDRALPVGVTVLDSLAVGALKAAAA